MSRNRVGFGRVLFHFLLGLATGGLWWMWLGVRFLLTH